jgi:hypothetical protein
LSDSELSVEIGLERSLVIIVFKIFEILEATEAYFRCRNADRIGKVSEAKNIDEIV